MCSNIPYTKTEMDLIKAIISIDRNALFKVKGKLETRDDYLYGGIEWHRDYTPIPYEQILEKINELIKEDYDEN